jgi:hypothetical protein
MLEGEKPECAFYLLYKYDILKSILKLPLGFDSLSEKNKIEKEIKNSMMLIKFGCFLLKENSIKEKLIFLVEENLEENEEGKKNAEKKININKNNSTEKPLLVSIDDISYSNEIKKKEILKNFQKSIYFCLLAFPYRKYERKIGKENFNGSKLIFKDSLKLTNELIKEIWIYTTSIEEIIDFVNDNKKNLIEKKLTLAKIIRKLKNPYFLRTVFISICYENLIFINDIENSNTNYDKENLNLSEFFIEEFSLYENKYNQEKIYNNYYNVLGKYIKFLDFIVEENLIHVDKLKPIFDGICIQKLLNIKAGKHLGELMEDLIEQQIINKNFNEEDAKKFLEKRKDELNIKSK